MMYIQGIGQVHIRQEEPNYGQFIPPAQLRRMSHIMKMGLYAGMEAMQQSGTERPDAIITASAWGCTEDTKKFIDSFISDEHGLGSPTPFIQSTHNSFAGQLAIHWKCAGYNCTYSQRGHSFESALFDAGIWLRENPGTVLCGIADENVFFIPGANLSAVPALFRGACFWALSAEKTEKSRGKIHTLLFRQGNLETFLASARAALPAGVTGSGSPMLCERLEIPFLQNSSDYLTETMPFAVSQWILDETVTPGQTQAFLEVSQEGYYSLIFVEKLDF